MQELLQTMSMIISPFKPLPDFTLTNYGISLMKLIPHPVIWPYLIKELLWWNCNELVWNHEWISNLIFLMSSDKLLNNFHNFAVMLNTIWILVYMFSDFTMCNYSGICIYFSWYEKIPQSGNALSAKWKFCLIPYLVSFQKDILKRLILFRTQCTHTDYRNLLLYWGTQQN